MSQFSGAGILESMFSNNNSINIQDEMLDEIYEDKHTVGKDSMTYYRTMLKEGYRISSSIGKQIYRWTWFASGSTIEKTLTSRVFGEGAASIYDNDIASSINKASVTNNDSYFTLSDFHSSYNSSLDLYAWMFLPYDPEDVTRYHTGCKMPPICYLALDRNSGTLMELHRQYFQHFIDLERDFKQTPLLTTFHCRKKNSSIRYDANTVMASGYLASEFQRILSGGLYINNNRKLSTIDRRIKGGTDFTQCVAKNYHPNTVDVPCILDFRVRNDQSRQPLDDKYFETAYSNKQPYLKYDDKNITLDKGTVVSEMTLEKAAEIIDGAATRNVLVDYKENENVKVMNGRYGAYITDGTNNYKIPKGRIAENLSYEDCMEIINNTTPTAKKTSYRRKK